MKPLLSMLSAVCEQLGHGTAPQPLLLDQFSFTQARSFCSSMPVFSQYADMFSQNSWQDAIKGVSQEQALI